MKELFLLIRLPLFLVRATAVITIHTLGCLFMALAGVAFFLITPPFFLLGIPFVFIKAAFKDRPEIFATYIKDGISEWLETPMITLSMLLEGIFSPPLKSALEWLLYGED